MQMENSHLLAQDMDEVLYALEFVRTRREFRDNAKTAVGRYRPKILSRNFWARDEI